MTRNRFFLITIGVVTVYGAALSIGIFLRMFGSSEAYAACKDLVGLFIAIPAAFLAFAFQRRLSYVQAARTLWRTVLDAVHSARSYTLLTEPSEREYRSVVEALSIGLDEVRSLFLNLPAKGAQRGWYPYEPLRDMLRVVEDLGCGAKATRVRRDSARAQLDEFWLLVRDPLLSEMDREVPRAHYTSFAFRRPLPPADGESA